MVLRPLAKHKWFSVQQYLKLHRILIQEVRVCSHFHLSVTMSCPLVAWQRSRFGWLPLRFGYGGIAPALSAAESEPGQHHPKPGSTRRSGAARPHDTVKIFTNIHISKMYQAEFSFRIFKYACKWLIEFLFLPVTRYLTVNFTLSSPPYMLQRPPAARRAADRVSRNRWFLRDLPALSATAHEGRSIWLELIVEMMPVRL